MPVAREAPQRSVTTLLGVAARKTGLTGVGYRVLERYRAFRAPRDPAVAADGLPLPPPLMRVKVVGFTDIDRFLADGRQGADVLRATLARNGVADMDDLTAMLDFGCGCGRIARHWADLRGPEVHGCDYNPTLAGWCAEHLDFMEARVNQLAPPLPYEPEQFDFVYAVSVFTHLSEPLQHAWMAEMRRVIRPGGYLFFTTKGDTHAGELSKPGHGGLAEYRAGRLVVTDHQVQGTNLCAAYHPYQWVVDSMLDGFELLEFSPGGSVMTGRQDFYLVRRVTP